MTLDELKKTLIDAGHPPSYLLPKDQFLEAVKAIKAKAWERDDMPKIWITTNSYLHNPHDTPNTIMFFGTMLICQDDNKTD